MMMMLTFWPRNASKRDICLDNVCPSVRSYHTLASHAKAVQDIEIYTCISYIPWVDVSIFLRPNFAILNLEVHPERVYEREALPPYDSENFYQ